MLIIDIEFAQNTKKSKNENCRFFRCCVDSTKKKRMLLTKKIEIDNYENRTISKSKKNYRY